MVKTGRRCCIVELAALLAVLACGGCGPNAPPAPVTLPSVPAPPPAPIAANKPPPDPVPANLPEWKADPGALEDLDDYYAVGDFEIRVPSGWNLHEGVVTGGEPDLKSFRWEEPGRADKSPASVGLWFDSRPAHQSEPRAPQLGWTVGYEVSHDAKDLKMTRVEYGKINGLTFARTNFKFTRAEDGAKIHGSAYIHWEGPVWYRIVIQDYDPGYEQTEAIRRASVLTFRKKAGDPAGNR